MIVPPVPSLIASSCMIPTTEIWNRVTNNQQGASTLPLTVSMWTRAFRVGTSARKSYKPLCVLVHGSSLTTFSRSDHISVQCSRVPPPWARPSSFQSFSNIPALFGSKGFTTQWALCGRVLAASLLPCTLVSHTPRVFVSYIPPFPPAIWE